MIALWAAYAWQSGVPQYIPPGPDKVVATLISDWPKLGPALVHTRLAHSGVNPKDSVRQGGVISGVVPGRHDQAALGVI